MAEGGHTATRSGGPERSPTGGEIGGTGMAGAVDEAAPIAAPIAARNVARNLPGERNYREHVGANQLLSRTKSHQYLDSQNWPKED